MFSTSYTDFDREIWAAELDSFVPAAVFDAHCHLWDDAHAGTNSDPESCLRMNVSAVEMLEWNARIFPGRRVGCYFLGTPVPGMEVAPHDDFVLREAAMAQSLCAPIVTPQMTPAQVESLAKRGARGLKPYRLFAAAPAECRIADYLPEAQMEVANDHALFVTLHLSQRLGLASEANRRDLELYARKYPRITWILAHCARAFNSFTLEEGRAKWLSDLGEKVFCDLSAVCDPRSHYLMMRHFDRKRLLFGSDNIGAGSDHGKYYTWGRAWGFARECDLSYCDGRATLVVYEQLRAMKQAAEMAALTAADLDDIFFRNAERLFKIGNYIVNLDNR